MKMIHQVFVYCCDEEGCDAAVHLPYEQLPPLWEEVRRGITVAPGQLETKHYCPAHSRGGR